MSDSTHEEAHTGPIKTPKQLLLAVFFSFVIPVFAIIGLVAYVVADNKPAGSSEAESHALGGMTAQDLDRGVAARIRKVGAVEIRDANRPLKSGEEVFKAQCTGCHTPGAAGAPKVGDAAAWGARISSGFDALVQSALKGKGAMPAQSGGDFDDIEIARAVAYMANSAGAKFAEPQRPAAARCHGRGPGRCNGPHDRAPLLRQPLPPLQLRAAAAPQTAAAGAAASARRSTSRLAWPATPQVWPMRPSWATRRPGRRECSRACRRWCKAPSRARARCRPRAAPPRPDAEIRAAVEYMVNASSRRSSHQQGRSLTGFFLQDAVPAARAGLHT